MLKIDKTCPSSITFCKIRLPIEAISTNQPPDKLLLLDHAATADLQLCEADGSSVWSSLASVAI